MSETKVVEVCAVCCQGEESEDVKPPVKVALSDCEVKLAKKWEALQKMGADYVRGMAYRHKDTGMYMVKKAKPAVQAQCTQNVAMEYKIKWHVLRKVSEKKLQSTLRS